MKYGATLHQRSPPEWEAYNVDYNEIKNLIKEHTTQANSTPIAIPGADEHARPGKAFESELYDELNRQHQRIELFVRSKTGETRGRLGHLERAVKQLTNHPQVAGRTKISVRRLERFSRLETEILKTGEQIQALARYILAQKLAFAKLLKKYRKWTGSPHLQARFAKSIASKPNSLENLDLDSLLRQYTNLLDDVRAPFEAGVTWKASDESACHPKNNTDNDLATNLGPAQELHRFYDEGTNLQADAALITVPFGSKAGHASYWVHPDNLLQVNVLLLQHARLKLGNSVSSSPRDTPIHTASQFDFTEAALEARNRSYETCGTVVCDDLRSFAKGRSGVTIDELEAGTGQRIAAAAASIRYVPSGECLVLIHPSNRDNRHSDKGHCISMPSKCKSKALRPLFDFENDSAKDAESGSIRTKGIESSFARDSPILAREWFRSHPEIQPLVQLRYKRSRFVGLGNTQDCGMWVTLDSEIQMKSSSADQLELYNESKEYQDFPHALLEVRWEGQDTPDLVHQLNTSYLVERIPGFSLEVHAVAILYRPSAMPSPHWLPALSRDIRKIPQNSSTTTRRNDSQSAFDNGDSNRPSTATNSVADAHSSSGWSKALTDSPATSIPEKNDMPPLEIPGSKRKPSSRRARRISPTPARPVEAKRYWNEFDDGEEAIDTEAYTVLVDPNTTAPLIDGWSAIKSRGAQLFNKLRATVRVGQTPDAERSPLLPTDYFSVPAAVDRVADSEGESDTSTSSRRPQTTSRYSTFPSYHSISSPLDPLSSFNVERRDQLLLRYTAVAFLSAFMLLIASGLLLLLWGDGATIGAEIGLVFGIVASMMCAITGVGLVAARQADIGWMANTQIGLLFALLCVGNGVLVVHFAAS